MKKFYKISFSVVDVVGILEQAGPLTHFRNRLGQEEQCVEFRITDMLYVSILLITNFIKLLLFSY